ncbi:MAG: hypothetical protein C4324_12450 [Blastocatellia bacterium]
MEDAGNFLIVFTTAANEDDTAEIARAILQAGLGACIQIVPRIRSLYVWNGKIADETECLILIKTTATAYSALEQYILSIHKYETPEIVAIRAENISEAYFKWVSEVVSSA